MNGKNLLENWKAILQIILTTLPSLTDKILTGPLRICPVSLLISQPWSVRQVSEIYSPITIKIVTMYWKKSVLRN